MSFFTEPFEKLSGSLQGARELARRPTTREAFERYKDAIGCALIINSEAESGTFPEALMTEGLSSALKSNFSLKPARDPKTSSISLVAATCYEAIEFAIENALNFEAYSIVEIVKSRRLFNELALVQLANYGFSVDIVMHDDFGPNGVKYILSSENKPTGMLCLYLSPLKNELHSFIIWGTSSDWDCSRRLILDMSETHEFLNRTKSYIRAIQKAKFERANQHLVKILQLLGARLQPQLNSLRRANIRKLIISPHAILHQIPLHAVPFEHEGKREALLAHFESVVFTPSLLLYTNIISDKDSGSWTWELLGNFDLRNLKYSAAGLVAFAKIFSDLSLQVVADPLHASTTNRIQGKTLIHFDCHGASYEEDFMNSQIHLIDAPLTFREILESFNFETTWLVFLNACETGLNFNSDNILDEYYGLDGAFLAKGALNVISTLVPVHDIAAFLLGLKVYIEIFLEEWMYRRLYRRPNYGCGMVSGRMMKPLA